MSKRINIFFTSVFILATLACNAISSIGQTTPTPNVNPEPTLPPTQSDLPLAESYVPRVTLDEALVAYDSGAAIFVDVRSRQSFDTGHIPGALSIPLEEMEADPAGLALPKNEWIITYCT